MAWTAGPYPVFENTLVASQLYPIGTPQNQHLAQNFGSLKLTRSVFGIHAAGHQESSRKLTAFVPRLRIRSLQQSPLSGPSFPPVGGAQRRCVLLRQLLQVSDRAFSHKGERSSWD